MSNWKADLLDLKPSLGLIIEETASYDLEAEIDSLVAELQEHPEEFILAIPGVSLKSVWDYDLDELIELMEADYPDPQYRRPTENRALRITRNKFHKPILSAPPEETAEFWLFVKEAIIQQEIHLLPPVLKRIAKKDRTKAKEIIARLKAKGEFGARKNITPQISSEHYTEHVVIPSVPYSTKPSTKEQKDDVSAATAMPEMFRRSQQTRAAYEDMVAAGRSYDENELLDLSIKDLDHPGQMTGASLSQLTLISPSVGVHKRTIGPGNNNNPAQLKAAWSHTRWCTGTLTATEVKKFREFEGCPLPEKIEIQEPQRVTPLILTKTQAENVRRWSLTRYRAIEVEDKIKYSGEQAVVNKRNKKIYKKAVHDKIEKVKNAVDTESLMVSILGSKFYK